MNSPNFKRAFCRSGFIALITVILMAAGMEAFSLAALSSAISYSDIVLKRELRMQARLNLLGCLDSARLELIKGLIPPGRFHFSDLACSGEVELTGVSAYKIQAKTIFQGVTGRGIMVVNSQDFKEISTAIQ